VADDAALEAIRPVSLREIIQWDARWQRILFRVLLPVELLV
jgi:hypothetical protein